MSQPTAQICQGCGGQLAADQRYCLNCGQRYGEARVDFRQHLSNGASVPNGAAPEPPAPVAAATPSEEKPQRDYTPLAAVGGIAILGLMLLVGVLIGKGDSPSTTAAPPIVLPEGSGTGGATASDEASGKEEGEKTAKAGKNAKVKGKKANDADSLTSGKGGSGPVVASDDALQELEEDSGSSYSEKSAKLPDEIATGGAPPPKDNEAPGGGSKGTAIE